MSKKEITIWNRVCNIDIVFDCFKGENITAVQYQALDNFLGLQPILLDSAKSHVVDFCKKSNPALNVVDNIFKYVMPQAIYVKRTKDETRVVGVMCAYKFDMEHGLVIVFKNENFEEIGQQDIIL